VLATNVVVDFIRWFGFYTVRLLGWTTVRTFGCGEYREDVLLLV
jgi:hypothetical protein